MPGIELVLFALDNTLFDHRSSAFAALETWLDRFDVRLTSDLVASWFSIEQVHPFSMIVYTLKLAE